MQHFHPHARRRRAQGALIILFVGLGALCVAFFRTQVLDNTAYTLQSDANRLRPLPIPAPRGTIYDRNGEIIADNVPGFALFLLPAKPDSIRAMLERISPVLDLDEERVESLMAKFRRSPGQPLLVHHDLTFEQVSALEERRPLLPGMYIEMQPKRRYLPGAVVGHLVGYVSEISQDELALPEFEDYSPGQLIGKAGLERQYEHLLGGRPGVRYVEVDANGRLVSDYGERLRAVAPVPGEDLHLELDLGLQRWISEIFPDSMRGAIVALEPETGAVLAMYSNPTFDPNIFVGGVDPEVWRQLNSDPGNPLLNRALAGRYPPGSTFKLFTAAIGLELGVIDPNAPMPLPCRGGMRYGNRYFGCWDRRGHGYVDLVDAIKQSCNVYFYQLGLKIGLDRFLEEAGRLGFRTTTGVDFPVELPGIVPSGRSWWKERFGYDPQENEVLSLSIGQGAIDQTPLKLAQLYVAFARDGRVVVPRFADLGRAPQITDHLDISSENLAVLREGLRRVLGEGGTARMASLEHWDLIGKTGTSQNPHGKDHALFTGMAGPRGGDPEIVVVAVLEAGEHGYMAAQYAAKTADYYLRRKYDMPIDTIQTLREHLLAGRPAPWAP